MIVPLQITFKGLEPSPALEARIRDRAARLDRFEDDIMGCHVTIAALHRHQQRGFLYTATIEIFAPGGPIVVSHDNPRDPAHADPYVTVRDAFDAAVRRVEDHVRTRGDRAALRPSPLARGRITLLDAAAGSGVIATDDGQDIAFDRTSVAGDAFDRLRVGSKVRLAPAEDSDGLRAGMVYLLDTPYPAS
ncbi:HPF/RaiA family ribosome-associated protein [Gluconacetobacter azotocaptans]|uniref:HPF/RaiA family ribosome-associated protein n=1 Tax=Gluconacetobacter azotocaptans TaxID=142834 RepID=A0A7W4JUU3_9PROT|nr:HPF/RaiA family ribosome-associated protein [Gluconacetobacter azotocaptans]MBB2191258.1 HPF/RaiA family ribosome-associated protein [Gluconacetobacter azotocaptans]GBQ25757.1 cold-shock protein [Gluconacetobacter azotocaptans DSM 13594]